jgi:hypothetical protein
MGLISIVILIASAVFLTIWLAQQSRAMQQASDFKPPEGSPPQADVLHMGRERGAVNHDP